MLMLLGKGHSILSISSIAGTRYGRGLCVTNHEATLILLFTGSALALLLISIGGFTGCARSAPLLWVYQTTPAAAMFVPKQTPAIGVIACESRPPRVVSRVGLVPDNGGEHARN